MAGAAKSIMIKGKTFKIPADAEVKVTIGGRCITENIVFGDGTSEGIEGVVVGKLEGIKVSTKGVDFDSLKELLNEQNLPVLYEDGTRSYELTGYIMNSDGIVNETKTDTTSEFTIVSNTGPVRVG